MQKYLKYFKTIHKTVINIKTLLYALRSFKWNSSSEMKEMLTKKLYRKLIHNAQHAATMVTEVWYITHHNDISNCIMAYMTVFIPDSCCTLWSRQPRNKALRVYLVVRICNQIELLLPDRPRACNSFSSSIQVSLMLSSSSSTGKSSPRIDLSTFKASLYLVT